MIITQQMESYRGVRKTISYSKACQGICVGLINISDIFDATSLTVRLVVVAEFSIFVHSSCCRDPGSRQSL